MRYRRLRFQAFGTASHGRSRTRRATSGAAGPLGGALRVRSARVARHLARSVAPNRFSSRLRPGQPAAGVAYAFPPLHLIPRVVQHALDTDSHLVLLVPNWPSQPWWPKLMSITTRSWLVGRKSDLFSRRAQSGEAWGYVPVLRPFFELLVCRVHASSAAASSPASADVSSGLRLTAVAASDPVVGAVPRIRCPPGTLVPPM